MLLRLVLALWKFKGKSLEGDMINTADRLPIVYSARTRACVLIHTCMYNIRHTAWYSLNIYEARTVDKLITGTLHI